MFVDPIRTVQSVICLKPKEDTELGVVTVLLKISFRIACLESVFQKEGQVA